MPRVIWHVYVKLDIDNQFEAATNKTDARRFLTSVGRAAETCDRVSASYNGLLVEAQGSTIHIILPSSCHATEVIKCCGQINLALKSIFSQSQVVKSWRMSGDYGMTIVVEGEGIHGDSSFVSLGNAANRPAKYLYSQLFNFSEEGRTLKKFHLALRQGAEETNQIVNLDSLYLVEEIQKSASFSIIERSDLSVQVSGISPLFENQNFIKKQARANTDVDSATNDDPDQFYGWVMRSDLDGFTKAVEKHRDSPNELARLAGEFRELMRVAREFADRHTESLVQLPWAGDNFTAVAAYNTKESFDRAIIDRLINLSLDFDDAMHDEAVLAGFEGWGHGIAGGHVANASNGNVYIGAIEIPGRRFLLAAGVGVGRSTQAFADMNPATQEFAVFNEDITKLLKPYKSALNEDAKGDGKKSTLYKKGQKNNLLQAREETEKGLASAANSKKTEVTVGGGSSFIVSDRPYCKPDAS